MNFANVGVAWGGRRRLAVAGQGGVLRSGFRQRFVRVCGRRHLGIFVRGEWTVECVREFDLRAAHVRVDVGSVAVTRSSGELPVVQRP